MPLQLHQDTAELKIAFWQIAETEDFFLEQAHFINPENLGRISHPQARLQWLASRLLLFRVLGADQYKKLQKDSTGKPITDNQSFELSISHSEELVAIAIAQQPIGIDIQRISSKMERIAHKFIPENQLTTILARSKYNLETLHVHWGIKEALFKAYGKGQLDFKEHLHLNWHKDFEPKGDSFDAAVLKDREKTEYSGHYEQVFEDYLFCHVTKKGI
jgi:4'-phosphopantetheinyl transferase